MLMYRSTPVPWNASWSDEAEYELRPCRWADGRIAVWSPHRPGSGRPIFAKPHFVRQRQSIARYLCTVCGEHTPTNDRWWFAHGEFIEGGWFTTQEAPVHHKCALLSMDVCPHLRRTNAELSRFPTPQQVICSVVGGHAVLNDFSIGIQPGRTVVGALKFAWAPGAIHFLNGRHRNG